MAFSPPWDGTWPGSYTYRFSDDASKTVAADPGDYSAVIHWTPKRAGDRPSLAATEPQRKLLLGLFGLRWPRACR